MHTRPLGPAGASACEIPPLWFDRETKAEFYVSLSGKEQAKVWSKNHAGNSIYKVVNQVHKIKKWIKYVPPLSDEGWSGLGLPKVFMRWLLFCDQKKEKEKKVAPVWIRIDADTNVYPSLIYLIHPGYWCSPSRHGPPPEQHSELPQDCRSPCLLSLRNPWLLESSLTRSSVERLNKH